MASNEKEIKSGKKILPKKHYESRKIEKELCWF